jgi:hypothetical protein
MSEESLRLGRLYSVDAHFDLAGVYAFIGNKEKAYEHLRIVSKIHVCPNWLLNAIIDDPLFKGIRNESEFQKFVKTMESRYQTENERVRKWLEERGEL